MRQPVHHCPAGHPIKSGGLSCQELSEQHIGGLACGFRGGDRDAHGIGLLIQIEHEEGAALPLLLDHPAHLPSGFRFIDKTEHQIVPGMFAHRLARQAFNPPGCDSDIPLR